MFSRWFFCISIIFHFSPLNCLADSLMVSFDLEGRTATLANGKESSTLNLQVKELKVDVVYSDRREIYPLRIFHGQEEPLGAERSIVIVQSNDNVNKTPTLSITVRGKDSLYFQQFKSTELADQVALLNSPGLAHYDSVIIDEHVDTTEYIEPPVLTRGFPNLSTLPFQNRVKVPLLLVATPSFVAVRNGDLAAAMGELALMLTMSDTITRGELGILLESAGILMFADTLPFAESNEANAQLGAFSAYLDYYRAFIALVLPI